ncbi:GGDEF domain-containing protein [Ningiella sp. W23]|uniref:GGDEF domain-containing protein n=1 Tax=Ningiella sp. W23 TaxID=3023715 RepID=UPI003757BC90
MNTPTSGRDHLEDSYKALENQQDMGRFQESMRVVCFAGAIIHILFLFFFAMVGASFMAAINVLSVAVWIGAYLLAHKRDYENSMHLITAEMYFHAIIASYFVGLDLGFHYYLWPVMGLLLAMPANKLKQSTFICVIVILTFIAVSILFQNVQYGYNLPSITNYVFAVNIVFAAFPFVLSVLYLRSTGANNEKELFSQANMDALTGTYNRRFVNDLMGSSDNEQRRRSFDNYTLVLGDVDHFKQINDSLGHQLGDQVIEEVAKVLKNKVRDSDIVSRWGGEEFLIILANADTQTTEKVVHKIRHGIKNEIDIPEVSEIGLSMSFGIASAHRHMSFEETVRQADIKLYQAKAAGRDRILS